MGMTAAGVHTIPADQYHADPCERPSLSASIASILCASSPKHAWTAHPRLNPDFAPHEEERFDIGRVAHALLLEGGAAVEVLDFADWRTKAAQEARDTARAAGRTPLLGKNWAAVEQMVAATRQQLEAINADPPLFTDGKAEQTLVWDDGGVLCRARLDWLRDDLAAIDDFKTTSASANPERWSKTLFGIGADVQAAMYLRGLNHATGMVDVRGTRQFRWAVQETYPPYALSVVSLAPSALELANAKVDTALRIWKRCLETDHWPAYPTQVAYAEAPAYEEMRWLEREAREAA